MPSRLTAVGAIRRAVGRTADDRTDATLLHEFYTRQDQSAFTALVFRHQRTVWFACSRVLTNRADIEDAFQATFLILARYGRLLGDRGEIGGWLYRVADRVARRLRAMTIQRQRRERKAVRTTEVMPQATDDTDLLSVVTEELARLPERYRSVILACDLDGLSRSAAAKRLGCSEGTLSARLHRGRKLLASLLRARGITAPLVVLGAMLAYPTQATAGLVAATAGLASIVAESGLTHRAVPATVAALVTHTTREMAMKLVTKAMAVIGVLVLAVAGVGVGQPGGGEGRASAAPVTAAKKADKPALSDATFQLLRNRKVLKELKCTAEQRVTFLDHFEDQLEVAAARPPFVPPPGQPRNPQVERQLIEARVKLQMEGEWADTRALAEKTLTAAQLDRLAQVELQICGANAFLDPKVAESLKLSDDQKKSVGDAIEGAAKGGVADPFAGPETGPVRAGGGARPLPLSLQQRKALLENAVEGLSKEQRAVWESLIGEPVKAFDPHSIGRR